MRMATLEGLRAYGHELLPIHLADRLYGVVLNYTATSAIVQASDTSIREIPFTRIFDLGSGGLIELPAVGEQEPRIENGNEPVV